MESQALLNLKQDISFLEEVESRISLETISISIDKALQELHQEIFDQCVNIKTEILKKLQEKKEYQEFMKNLKNLKALAHTI